MGRRPGVGRDFVRPVVLLGVDGCLAPTLMYATSGGLSGVVRAAVEAKGRVPS